MTESVRAYFMRHGSTSASPSPEKWKPLPLSDKGRAQAVDGAIHLASMVSSGVWPAPDRVVSSDLPRAKQTADIAAQMFQIPSVSTSEKLRAFNDEVETPQEYEARTASGLGDVLAGAGRPLIVAHRSTTGYLDQQFFHPDDEDFNPDYVNFSLLKEGGILGVRNPHGLVPLWQPVQANWPPGFIERLGVDT